MVKIYGLKNCDTCRKARKWLDRFGVAHEFIDYRDDKVAFFWRSLPAGVHRITYDLRATIPGDYHVMPSSVYNMYVPEVWGSGPESRLQVR